MTISPVVSAQIINRIAVISSDSPPVNTLSLTVRQGIDGHMREAMANPAVDAIILTCKGKTFFAGAEIKELGSPPVSPKISELNALAEDSPKPVIAAMHGTVLGGGLELALSCHYRIAVPSTRCGLTEVTLGILPGAGGTQRLTRVVGVEKSLQMITSGEHINAQQSMAMGLYDCLANENSLLDDALAYATDIVAKKQPLIRVRDREDKLAEARNKPDIFEQFRKTNGRKFKGFNAPERCIRCIEAALTMPFDEGLKFEKVMFAELIKLGQAAALQYAFFAQRQIKKIPNQPVGIEPLAINAVGIIGAGTMGGGIAMNFANIGIAVTLIETKQDALDRGMGVIRKNYQRSMKRGKLSAHQVEQRMALLQGSLDYKALADCDLVIEAVFENMAVKQSVFRQIDEVVGPHAIMATNTSFLDIDAIASATTRPERVIGMHFFSPANVMKLLEVVRTPTTDKQVIASVMAMGAQVGKVAVLVGNCDGFVGNRIVVKRKEQAQAMLLEGAMPWQIDKVVTGLGFPMGSFAMSDMAGLDIGWSADTSDPEAIRDLLCDMGRRGQKTGAGYYNYDDNRKASPSTVVEKLIQDFLAARNMEGRTISDEEILQRCIFPMINEACKVLEEGIAIRASDIDVIMVNGYGFPRYLGGLCFYADTVGLDKVLAIMEQLEQQLGETMKPAALLKQLVADAGRLSKYSNA